MFSKANIKKWALNSWFLHLLFWFLSYYVLLHIFAGSSEIQKIDWIYTAVFMSTLMLAVFPNLYFLVPTFLPEKRYLAYFVAFIISLLLFSYFNYLLFDRLIDYVLPGYYFISYYSYWDIVKFFLIFLSITTMLKLSREWFTLSEVRQKMARIEKEKIETELKALKNQVNPHFLFNSLNVLYSLVRKNATEAPDAIIKLSDILRYALYETNTDFVPLKKELKMIRDYIDLQSYRVNTRVSFSENIENEDVKIVPMLLLPLFENAYKHGTRSKDESSFIKANIDCGSQVFNMTLSNSKSSKTDSAFKNESGIGLENIRKRLEHYYEGRYKLDIFDEKDVFKVSLQIELDANEVHSH